jgi:SAM-dependent methyltransferase
MDIERYSEKLADPFLAHEHAHRYWWASKLVAGKVVVDIACGTGYGSAILAQSAKKVFGIDIAAEAIAEAKERYSSPNVCFWQGDCATFSLAEQADVAISFETFEHLSQDDQDRFLSKLHAALKEDGLAIISTPNVRQQHHHGEYQNPFHVHEVDLHEFREKLATHFKHVAILGQRIAPASFISPADDIALQFSPMPDALAIDHSRSVLERPTAPILAPVYLLAIASNHELPKISGSTLMDNSFALAVASAAALRLTKPASHFASLPERVAEVEKYSALLKELGGSNVFQRTSAIETELIRQIERISKVVNEVEAQRTAQHAIQEQLKDDIAQLKAALLEQQLSMQQLSNRRAEGEQPRAAEPQQPLSLQLVKTLHALETSLSSMRTELREVQEHHLRQGSSELRLQDPPKTSREAS